MADFIINTDDNVYIPAEDSYLLADNLEIKKGQSVLEIGTGSGIVAMYASRLTDKITVTDINFDWEGEIAGSKLTLNVACRNMMTHTGASIVDVFKFASYNPSRAVGLLDRGEIAVGKRADLVVTDYKMNIKNVILKGEIQ